MTHYDKKTGFFDEFYTGLELDKIEELEDKIAPESTAGFLE